MSVDTMSSDGLRDVMVDELIADHEAKGLAMRPEVEAALRAVPRELYTPGVPVAEAYRSDTAVITKKRGDETVSSVSAPWLIAEMLGQAADALDGGLPGRHVLEIGSGGYNASLLRELVGPSGSVMTVDIDPEVTERAVACLAAAGYGDVTVVCADAEQPIDPGRRFDLIIVTAGAWDIPPAWITQLVEGGVLVVPLRTFGMTRSWALRRNGDRLVSQSQRLCGFVAMQGAGTHEMRYVDVAEGVHLRLDEGQQVNPESVRGLLSQPRVQAWAGVDLPPRTVLADLDLWLAARLADEVDQLVVLSAQQEAVDAGVVAPGWRFGTPAALHDGTFVYRSALCWIADMFDLGACAHGSNAVAAAGQMVAHMRAWVEAGEPSPRLHVLPAGTPDGDLPAGTVLDKRHSRLVLTFTSA
ncbi:methyltransferase, FxLD system [Micromonospora craterilacus]|uniref:Protein-L-isoaspartate O-methyltransferase n=1 Tax=Micromonospora craterilacus TaxID=1655439 RepID=A0A2W2FDF2_9ACTN|nr:methyltransferase, FxLD system [Micromonospora craterilacus]PZG13524.1 methyltransferase, FxLD system [Micromonospora craterilacus]